MPANPKAVATARSTSAGEAEDRAEIFSLREQAEVPFGHFRRGRVLMTKDVNPLEPRILEFKFYARGVGPVLAVSVSGSSDRESCCAWRRPAARGAACTNPYGGHRRGAWAQSSNGCPLAGGSAQVRPRWCSLGFRSLNSDCARDWGPRPRLSGARRRGRAGDTGHRVAAGRRRSRLRAPPRPRSSAEPVLRAAGARPPSAARYATTDGFSAGRGLVVVPAEPGLGSEARGLPRFACTATSSAACAGS